MKKAFKLLPYLYKHNLVRYLLVGGSTFAIDILLLFLLHGKLHIKIAISTSISYWFSIAYNFSLNKFWTFSASNKKKLHENLIPYFLLLGFNYLFTVIFVSLASHHINYLIAKVIAVLIQTCWTYTTYKHIVFADSKNKNSNVLE